MERGLFRVRGESFSMVSNAILKDTNISAKAKGMYAVIKCYITIPNFKVYKTYLQRNCFKEGEKAFETMWKELKDNGYLKQYRIRDAKTNSYVYEYELLDTPDLSTPSTINVSINGEIIPEKENNISAQQDADAEQQSIEETAINVDDEDTVPELPEQEKNDDEIKNNIEYEYCKENRPDLFSFVDTCYELIKEVMHSKDEKIRIASVDKQLSDVQERFKKITLEHIEYIQSSLADAKPNIKNIKKYLMASLYNAPITIDSYYDTKINHDMQNE